MPRGRHRHSPPLHKLLPPSAVAGASVVCAAGAWLLGDALVLRLLVAAAAAAAVTGAVLMRSWDQSAGRQVAELTRARTADQWKHDERIAELEADLEESRELRTRLDAKLRAKRVELAGLRSEHADLLRRYATAETERASALEGRRVLALESGTAAASQAKALPPAGSTPTPEAYRRAAEALRNLENRAEKRHAAAETEKADAEPEAETAEPEQSQAGQPTAGQSEPEPSQAGQPTPGQSQAGQPEVQAGSEVVEPKAALTPAEQHARTAGLRTVPAAAAIVPYAARRPARPAGGFDYFGTQAVAGAKKAAAAIEAVQHTDLADVVGEEVLAEAAEAAEAAERRPAEPRAIGQVIDLTAHDETEQLDMTVLRGAVNS
ncbi:hypothetical protein ACFYU9_20935 [Streptomyces sp. NPDC004327]|uniref:hypothetical protein n=1 Tax=Streptomyces sp. NPDC004327 TaxID=3364699 RepID=UPI0036D0B092